MPLATLREVMDFARERTCGIGMFNVVDLEYAEAIVGAAEELDFPVILGYPEVLYRYHPMERAAELLVGFAKNAKIPAVVHLDHGGDFDAIMMSMKLGFTSVMFDGSALPYEENIRRTGEIVKVAHAMGVSVEGELGYIGFDNNDESGRPKEGSDAVDVSRLTKPGQAGGFAARTGIDALAIAIGNQHGHYKGKPKLDFQRLQEIKKACDCGLVLHGGSGLSDGDYTRAVSLGINKINIYTSMNDFVLDFLRAKLPAGTSWLELTKELRIALTGQVKGFIKLFGRIA